MRRIGVIDVGSGNVPNVERALRFVGFEPVRMKDVSDLDSTINGLVLPGVGHFDTVVEGVDHGHWREDIVQWIKEGRLFLGICVGHQILARASEEGRLSGLGLVDSVVVDMNTVCTGVKIPHMGWNSVRWKQPGFSDGYAYFVHTYAIPGQSEGTVATTEYGGFSFASISRTGERAYSTQFHPEKSGNWGLDFLHKVLSQ